MDYCDFIKQKEHVSDNHGFNMIENNDMLFDFQNYLVEWALLKGRGAIFADCGMGKTPMQLLWAKNVAKYTNGRVLIITPLFVSAQTVEEGEKFGIEVNRVKDGNVKSNQKIVITNYEKLSKFDSNDFTGVVCDESSILKNFDGVYKSLITKFLRKIKYRLLCTATASPNDYTELGTSSEALGYLGYVDMLQKYFSSNENTFAQGGGNSRSSRFQKPLQDGKFRFKGHSSEFFWKWVCTWARAIRKPSDFGFDDNNFILPKLTKNLYTVKNRNIKSGFLFEPANTSLREQHEERRRTLPERCEMAADIINKTVGHSIAWCNLNDESKIITKLIDDSVEITGSDSDDKKESALMGFKRGEFKCLVTKSKIAGMGMNFQHCRHQTFFPSHSFEQFYQCVRRSWRFGQKKEVVIDLISSEGESQILANLNRKEKAASEMYDEIIKLMSDNQINTDNIKNKPLSKVRTPKWI